METSKSRRGFLKNTAITGGGLFIGFHMFSSCTPKATQPLLSAPTMRELQKLNGYVKVGTDGIVTIMAPNPEIGQNVKTSMPMIVAEELDVLWENVLVEQAPLDTTLYKRQIAGGSQSIRAGWKDLRTAGASARQMLREAAAQAWQVPLDEITTDAGMLYHKASGKSAGYGEMATAASKIPVPKEVQLKAVKDFKIIGTPRKNVDGPEIVSGKHLFGLDYKREGMLIAMVVHPPAFGLTLKSMDDAAARKMPGIVDVFSMNTYKSDHPRAAFDIDAFPELVVVVGKTTWEVMQAKKAIKVEWMPAIERNEEMEMFGRKVKVRFPVGLENTSDQQVKMAEMATRPAKEVRKDGDPATAFKNAATILERTYTAPYLAHNCMEPMNFFADVNAERADLVGSVQLPEIMQKSAAARLGMPLERVSVQMTRMGGGFGRRLYGHFVIEAAVISQKMNKPIKLVYSREDDMTSGVYRPMYHAVYRAALDANKNLIGFHIIAGGIPESPLHANRFPAGAIDNYLAEEWSIDSNVTTGAYRAPRSNFIAAAEQSFLDELAEMMGKDPIAFRLELLSRAKSNPVGKDNDYDAGRYAGVLELVRDKSGWASNGTDQRGVSAYYCHNSYVAQVLDLELKDGQPEIKKVHCAVDCGIVVNPIGATNLVEGGIVDGIGNALYSQLTIKDGVPEQKNFHQYRLIRHSEAPKEIEVHFVKNEIDPTGLGEPPFPPIFGAVANALYRRTGKRYYDQPFFGA
jgi:isoquinoline 1-oxidoreductase subunit beta